MNAISVYPPLEGKGGDQTGKKNFVRTQNLCRSGGCALSLSRVPLLIGARSDARTKRRQGATLLLRSSCIR